MEPEATAGNGHQEVKTLTITLPSGKWAMPAWMATALIESIVKHDTPVYARHMIAVQTGADPRKPGRRGGE